MTLKRILLLVLCCFVAGRPWAQQSPADLEEWEDLFNGRNLKGWLPKIKGYAPGKNFGKTFRVRDGLLTVAYDKYDRFESRFGHLFFKRSFGYYRLEVEYRFVGEQCPGGPDWAIRNSGIMLHGQPAASMTKEQDFPISLEAQLLGGDGVHERATGNLCTPGTHVVMNGALVTDHCITSTSATYHGDQWVRAMVEVYGDSLIRHWVEGEVVIEYTKPTIGGGVVHDYDPTWKVDGQPLTSGSISLQSESHPLQFRRVALLDLEGCMDAAASNFKSYYVKHAPSRCQD